MLSQLYKEPFKDIVESLTTERTKQDARLILGLDGSSIAVLIAQAYDKKPATTLVITSTNKKAQELYEDLNSLLPEVELYLYMTEDVLALEFTKASPELLTSRVLSLDALGKGRPAIVVASFAALRSRLTPVDYWKKLSVEFVVGERYDLKELEERLTTLGYKRESMVEYPGSFSVRGGIIDFFPLGEENPIRLDFFDDELDSIRHFDSNDQRSLANLDKYSLISATDVVFPISEQVNLVDEFEKRSKEAVKNIKDSDLQEIVEGGLLEQLSLLKEKEGLRYQKAYLELWDSKGTSLLDYLPETGRLFILDYGKYQERQNELIREESYWLEAETKAGRLLPGIEVKQDVREVVGKFEGDLTYISQTQQGLVGLNFSKLFNVSYRSMNRFFGQIQLIKEELSRWQELDLTIQIITDSKKGANTISNLLEEQGLNKILLQEKDFQPIKGAINIMVGSLNYGFEIQTADWVVVTYDELLGKTRRKKPAYRSDMSNVERIKDYQELKAGDYVVHINHGIGKYTGIETIELKSGYRDMLAIEFEGSSRILIPVDQIQLIQKYVSSEGVAPKLSTLGGTSWAKTKKKVQAQAEDIADQLIEIYAERQRAKGFAFSPDTPEQIEFEEEFPYVETPDQLRSIDEIKRDMEREQPMDRLLVGDVGYGKTEVAMRAAFKAVMDGKQVAFLVPTTVLAQQHYNTLKERFATWPFEIEMLSRFVTPKRQKEIIQDIKIGKVSIVIGTHRLLSKDVEFNDLGLLIIDEEQRFGVKHKERLKSLKSSVDVLTLTATPIPRTLHMSMTGVRDLSVIETPPTNRFPVQTYVLERNEATIRSAIDRELSRGGQVFYLYNRVDTIYQRAEQLQSLVPEVRIAVAHGRLTERQLEKVLLEFIDGEYDILVTTTIIETGVDIPNANTLFVERADRMGLSTLYQLRGRVGRSHRVAYAYLMYEPGSVLSEESEKRLSAIREFTDLGSGFKLAMQDLSIRGAGNLLGKEQSGFIDSVGFDLYAKLIQEAVDRKQGKHQKKAYVSDNLVWETTLEAYIPNAYIEDEKQKLSIYKLIQRISDLESYRDLQDELIDRFGEYPTSVANLLDIALIKANGIKSGIEKIKQTKKEVTVTYSTTVTQYFHGVTIMEVLQNVPMKAKIKLVDEQLEVTLDITGMSSQAWLKGVNQLAKAGAKWLEENIKD